LSIHSCLVAAPPVKTLKRKGLRGRFIMPLLREDYD
jgi:hypothetical protein